MVLSHVYDLKETNYTFKNHNWSSGGIVKPNKGLCQLLYSLQVHVNTDSKSKWDQVHQILEK